ncbi:MAG TPA: class I SAM-dependent methyltransferase [Candidatus Methylomirabilis sp.]|nr:class I SAM-dependent methyltransferase [Candidatus Methylomirabilis sp.]
MATPSTTNRPNPEHIFTLLQAFQHTEALKTGIELDIFTIIGAGASTPGEIARKADASERGIRILCDFLTIMGLLTKTDGHYSLTEESALFLNRRSPACLATMAGFISAPWHKKNVESLTAAVRRGGSVGAEGDNTKPQDEVWVAFAKCMMPLTVPAASFIAQLVGAEQGRAIKVLDIAAGHGNYGITIAKKNPNAQIVALDWPAVLTVALENAQAAGVSDRYTAIGGSAFETELGSGYDFVLLTNIFHHFDRPTCEKLMRRVHATLKPGGKAITLEFVPNEDRVTPPAAGAFSLNMLVGTDAGDAYTLSEYEKMFGNSGFGNTELQQVPNSPQQVMINRKPE